MPVYIDLQSPRIGEIVRQRAGLGNQHVTPGGGNQEPPFKHPFQPAVAVHNRFTAVYLLHSLSYLGHDREGDTVVPSCGADDFLPCAWLATPELVAREGDYCQLFLGVIGPKRLKLTIMSVRVFAMASDIHNKDHLRFVGWEKAARALAPSTNNFASTSVGGQGRY